MKKMEISVIFAIMILGFSVNRGYAEVFIVTMEDEPVVSYRGGVNGFEATAVESDEKIDVTSELVTSYARHLEKKHDMILGMLFERGTYKKIYSYRHLINGFAVHTTPEQ